MQQEKDNSLTLKRLSSDPEYFKNVFKRTEKLISVIFYILSYIEKDKTTFIQVITEKALKTHELSLKTLRLLPHETAVGMADFQLALFELESSLKVAEAAGLIPNTITPLIFEQMMTVDRIISNHYLETPKLSLEPSNQQFEETRRGLKPGVVSSPKVRQASPVRRRMAGIPAGDISSDAYMVYSQLTDRAERIKTVLEAKPQATIKDISEIITDVSEKTIQRELNSLIEKGQVHREGERRWSKYSVVK